MGVSGCCGGGVEIGPEDRFPVSGMRGADVMARFEGRYDGRIRWRPDGLSPDEDAFEDFPFVGETGLHIELSSESDTWYAADYPYELGDCRESGSFTVWTRVRIWTDDGALDDEVRTRVEHGDNALTVRGDSSLWRAYISARNPRERPEGSLKDYDPRTDPSQILDQSISFEQTYDGDYSFTMTLRIESDGRDGYFGESRVVAALVE